MDLLTGTWPLGWSIAGLIAAGAVLLVTGVRITKLADALADVTGVGEAVVGAVMLGFATSLSGVVTSVVGALDGRASFAVSNALGGIAVQTLFIAAADLAHRNVNLEHAAASLPNVLQAFALCAMLGLILMAIVGPDWSLWAVNPMTPVLLGVYLYSQKLVRQASDAPMWHPRQTDDTREDVPDDDAEQGTLAALLSRFLLLAAALGVSGFVVARAGISLADRTGVSDTLVGGFVTSTVTSLPELITAVAAVRIGALTLAVGDILGGNVFDVLFMVAIDVAYREGSVYAAISEQTVGVVALALVMTAILGAGLIHRGRRGIGFEGIALVVAYVAGFVLIALAG